MKQSDWIELQGRRIPYQVRHSKRARRCRLEVTPEDGLTVILPRGIARSHIPEVLREEAAWVLKQIDRIAALPPPAVPKELQDGSEIIFRGEPRALRLRPPLPDSRYSRVRPNGKDICIDLQPEHEPHLRAVLTAWMRNQAKWIIRAEVHDLAEAHGFEYNRVYVKDQKTKWGSCSSRRNLSFSWRLVMAPPGVLTYLVAHELAHLKEFRHTEAFWQFLAEIYPGYEQEKRWLEEYGHTLRF